MSNPTGKGGFRDHPPHINRKGRPRSFDALRKLAIKIAIEQCDPDDPESLSMVEKLLRGWAMSRERESQERFIDTAYGKIPTPVDVTSGGKPIFNIDIIDDDTD